MTTLYERVAALTMKQTMAEMKALSAEIDVLAAKGAADFTDADEKRFRAITREFTALEAHHKDLVRSAEVAHVRSAMATGHIEHGIADYERDPYGTRMESKMPARNTRSAELLRRVENPWDPNHDTTLTGPRARDLALAAAERSIASDDGKDRIIRGLDGDTDDVSRLAVWTRAASDPEYTKAFFRLAANPNARLTDTQERAHAATEQAMRALSLTDSAGGYLAPFHLDPAVLLQNAGSISPIRQISRRVTITTDTWNGVSSAGVSIGFAAEATEASDNSPTFAQPSISVHKYQGFVPISIEAFEDEQNVAGEVTRILQDAVTLLENEKFITGTGSGQPFGIVTALAGGDSEVAEASSGTFTSADVFALLAAVPPRYRANAQWVAPIETMHSIQKMETANGAPLFPEISGGQLLRRAISEASNMDGSLTASSNNYVLLVGSFSEFVICDRVGARIEFIPHLVGANRRPTGQRGWYLYGRYGADSVNDDAFRMLNVSVA